MAIETVQVTDHRPLPDPSLKWRVWPWWFQGPDGWNVPEVNNGEPYLPAIKATWLRRLIWFGFRNPLMNFVGFIIGVEDVNYLVTGSAPVLATTGRDCRPPQEGWRWAILHVRGGLPFVSYYRRGWIEFYLGWRPASGGFGLKLVRGK